MNTYEKITEEVNVDHMLEVASGLAKWERLSGSDGDVYKRQAMMHISVFLSYPDLL